MKVRWSKLRIRERSRESRFLTFIKKEESQDAYYDDVVDKERVEDKGEDLQGKRRNKMLRKRQRDD